jgi:enoyl-CoA hydratase
VNEVVPATELIPRCEVILKQINANASLAIRYSIDAVNEGADTDLSSGLKLEAKYFVLAADTKDRKKGTSAFVRSMLRNSRASDCADPGRTPAPFGPD